MELKEYARVIWVGLGCQRGVSKNEIGQAIEWVFTNYNLDLATIAGIATLDRKIDEVGLIDYCHESGWFLKIYPPERLNSVIVPQPSTLVTKLVGTASVAEAAALCAAQTDVLLVPKQKFRLNSESRSVTIAIAASKSR
jgi:cobalt-precorrin 5A hydrolase/precorrin-3B C17-methyltransferase